jgi:hypothetical protein
MALMISGPVSRSQLSEAYQKRSGIIVADHVLAYKQEYRIVAVLTLEFNLYPWGFLYV